MNKLLIVGGIGLDLDDTGGRYLATLEFINIEGETPESGIIEGEGDSVYSAIQNAMVLAGGAMFANHCKVMVFGENLARRGIEDAVNLVLRSPGFRKTLDVLVAKGTTAGAVVKSKALKSDITSFELSKLISSNADTLNNTKSVSVYELHERLLSDCPSAALPTVFLEANNGGESARVEGAALIYQGRLRGFLTAEQSKLYNLLLQNADNGYLSFEAPSLSQKPVNARVKKSSAVLEPYIDGDRLVMRVNIQAEVILEDVPPSNIDLLDERSIMDLQNDFSLQLSGETGELIGYVQDNCETDVFYFHKEYEDLYRGEWPRLKEDWASRFRDISVETDAKVVIAGSGLIGNYRPLKGWGPRGNALP